METRVSHKCIEVGKTLYQAPGSGTPRFSARAAYLMLYELCAAVPGRLRLYDPFCGNGVLLVTAFLLYAERLTGVYGADLDPAAVETARRNLEWLRDRGAMEERLRAVRAFKTADEGLKELFQQRCRRMFEKGRGIGLDTGVERRDVADIGAYLGGVDGPVCLATDPPYEDGEGALEGFLERAAAAENVAALVLCYPLGRPVLPLLERFFRVETKRGSRGRAIYLCMPA